MNTTRALNIVATKAQLMHNISNNVASVVKFQDLHILPCREDFIDAAELRACNDDIAATKPIYFMPNDVLESWERVSKGGPAYSISIFGALVCGLNAIVTLTNIPIYVDVSLVNITKQTLAATFIARKIPIRIETILAKPLQGFCKEPLNYARVHFNSLADRRVALEVLNAHELSSNDIGGQRSYYYKLVARTFGFNTASWNVIDQYVAAPSVYGQPRKFTLDVRNYTPLSENIIKVCDALVKDKLVIASWDIETESNDPNGQVPGPTDKFDLAMINTNFYWQYTATALVEYVCVSVPTTPKRGVVIQCESERDLLIAHSHIWAQMQMNLSSAYNGSSFDWPLTIAKLKHHGLLTEFYKNISLAGDAPNEANIDNYAFTEVNVKLSAERSLMLPRVGKIPGVIDIDSMSCMMQLYPKAEMGRGKSLNYFLSINGLESKDDMSYKRIFEIYRASRDLRDGKPTQSNISPEQLAELMGDVAYYCTIDCLRPQQLIVKQTVLSDKREMANLASITIRDAFYKADSMKVINLVGKFCHQQYDVLGHYIAPSMQNRNMGDHSKEHYPGGFVFQPTYGLNTFSPVTGLDFNSLYPSIMFGYNMSTDMIVKDPVFAEQLMSEGYDLHPIGPIPYEIGEKKNALGNKSSVMQGWTVRHDITIKPTTKLPGMRMGIMPTIVKTLFDMRLPLKREYSRLEKIIEAMGINNLQTYTTTINDVTRVYTLDEIHFFYNKINSKQKAVKVLANTVYGTMGSFRSPIYNLLIAAGITEIGRNSIKKVAEEVQSRGFRLQYGDTDSVYVECPERYYDTIRAHYDPLIAACPTLKGRGDLRVKYWTELVTVAIRVMGEITKEMNQMLRDLTNTIFLALAYEEVGMPTNMMGKKKYVMTPHIEAPNFGENKKRFIRGIDIIKQGKTQFIKQLGYEYIDELLSPYNELTPMELCDKYIAKAFAYVPNVDELKQTACYKPNKRNIPVLKFISRMQYIKQLDPAAPFDLPEPGDKFEYVVVRKAKTWSCTGKAEPLNKGDKMEFVSTFKNSNLELDMKYYLTGELIGLFARFIAADAQFQPVTTLSCDDHDPFIIKNATEYLTNICNKHLGNNNADDRQTGQAYAAVYKSTVKQSKLSLSIAQQEVFYGDTELNPPPISYDPKPLMNMLVERIGIYKLIILAQSYYSCKISAYTRLLNTQLAKLTPMLEEVKGIKFDREQRVEQSVLMIRTTGDDVVIDNINNLTAQEDEIINNFATNRREYQLHVHNRSKLLALISAIQKEQMQNLAYQVDSRGDALKDAKLVSVIPAYQWK